MEKGAGVVEGVCGQKGKVVQNGLSVGVGIVEGKVAPVKKFDGGGVRRAAPEDGMDKGVASELVFLVFGAGVGEGFEHDNVIAAGGMADEGDAVDKRVGVGRARHVVELLVAVVEKEGGGKLLVAGAEASDGVLGFGVFAARDFVLALPRSALCSFGIVFEKRHWQADDRGKRKAYRLKACRSNGGGWCFGCGRFAALCVFGAFQVQRRLGYNRGIESAGSSRWKSQAWKVFRRAGRTLCAGCLTAA